MIKTLYLFIALLSCFVAPGQTENAQIRGKGKFLSTFVVFGGPGLSSLRGNSGVDNNSQNKREVKVSYTYGIGASHKINSRFDLAGNFFFEGKGGRSTLTGLYFDEADQTFKIGKVASDYNYRYLTVSAYADARFGKNREFNIGCGPYGSYLKKQTLTQTALFNGSIGTSDDTKYNRKFDFGLSGEVGWEISLDNNKSLSIRIVQSLGLINIRPMITDGEYMKTSNTSLLVGLKINNYKLNPIL